MGVLEQELALIEWFLVHSLMLLKQQPLDTVVAAAAAAFCTVDNMRRLEELEDLQGA